MSLMDFTHDLFKRHAVTLLPVPFLLIKVLSYLLLCMTCFVSFMKIMQFFTYVLMNSSNLIISILLYFKTLRSNAATNRPLNLAQFMKMLIFAVTDDTYLLEILTATLNCTCTFTAG